MLSRFFGPMSSKEVTVSMRARTTTLGLVSVVAAVLAAQVGAQEPAPPSETEPPQAIEEVVVRGRRMGEIDDELRIYIKDFIDEVVRTPPGRGYARWNRRVCIGVHNLQADAAQYIVDRISVLAVDVGLEVGEPGCNPNVIVIFATDAKFVATYMVENEPLMFRPAGLGSGDMSSFARGSRGVRRLRARRALVAREHARGRPHRQPCDSDTRTGSIRPSRSPARPASITESATTCSRS